MRTDDAPALAAYRNDSETARYQDWAVPFSTDDAARFVDKQVATVWPLNGDWVQLAVARDGRMIGDIAVCRSSDGMQAQIGYTLAPVHRGVGFATEAVGAVIDLLFAEGVHRVWATLDPENIASARLLERFGFRFEGRSTHAAHVRGQWCDDLCYALLVDERSVWLERPLHRPGHVVFIEIDWRTSRDVRRLATHHSQEQFVATVDQSFADALTPALDEYSSAPIDNEVLEPPVGRVPSQVVDLRRRLEEHHFASGGDLEAQIDVLVVCGVVILGQAPDRVPGGPPHEERLAAAEIYPSDFVEHAHVGREDRSAHCCGTTVVPY